MQVPHLQLGRAADHVIVEMQNQAEMELGQESVEDRMLWLTLEAADWVAANLGEGFS